MPLSEVDQQLLEAAKNGELAGVEHLVSKGANVNAKREDDGWTPIHSAAFNGHTHVMEWLFSNGAKIDAKLSYGWMPIHVAASQGQISAMQWLFSKRIKIDQDDYMNTLLLPAVRADQISVVDLLLSFYEIYYTKDTTLHFVIKNSSDDLRPMRLAALLQIYKAQGLSIDIADETGTTPLMYVIKKHDIRSIALLLSAGAAVGQKIDGIIDLHYALAHSDADMVAVLSEAYKNQHVSVDIKDEVGTTPLMYAIKKGGARSAKFWLDAGAAVGQKIDGIIDLHYALAHSDADMVAVLSEAYKNQHVSVDIKDEVGTTPLMYAIKKGGARSAKFLLDAGAAVGQKIDGIRDLPYALDHREPDMVAVLSNAYKDRGIPVKDLHSAIKKRVDHKVRAELVEECIKGYKSGGISIDIEDKTGATPLMCALEDGYVNVAKLLLRAGADITRTVKGSTYLHFVIAQKSVLEEEIKSLEKQLKPTDYRSYDLDDYESYFDQESYRESEEQARKHAMIKQQKTKRLLEMNSQMLEVLIKTHKIRRISVDYEDKNGLTPLMHAIKKANVCAVELLLEAGAALNKMVKGSTYLHFILEERERLQDKLERDLVPRIVTRTVCSDVPQGMMHQDGDDYEWIDYGYSVTEGRQIRTQEYVDTSGTKHLIEINLRILEIFIKAYKTQGVSLNRKNEAGYTAFMHSMLKYKEDLAKYFYLVDMGVNPNTPDANGVTPLIYAVKHGWVSVVKALLCKDVSIGSTDNLEKDAIDYALSLDSSIGKDIIKNFAFREAAIGNEDVIKKILFQGFDSNSLNNIGQTLLYVACYNRHPKIVELLLNSGASPNEGWDKITPGMVLAGYCGDTSKNTADQYCCSGVFLSDHSNQGDGIEVRLSILKLLVKFGADLSLVDSQGRNVYSIAQQYLIGGSFKQALESFGQEQIMPHPLISEILAQKVDAQQMKHWPLEALVSGILYDAGVINNAMFPSLLHETLSDGGNCSLEQLRDFGWIFYLNHPEYMSDITGSLRKNMKIFMESLITGPVKHGQSLKDQLALLIDSPDIKRSDVRDILLKYNPVESKDKESFGGTSESLKLATSEVGSHKDTVEKSRADKDDKDFSYVVANSKTSALEQFASKNSFLFFKCSTTASTSSCMSTTLPLFGHDFRLSTTHPALTLSDVSGDGNCFFYAVAEQLAKISDSGESSMDIFELRRFAVNYVNAYREDFKDFIPNESPEQYIARVERNNQWADHVLIKALALELQINIVILEPGDLANLKAPIIVTRDDAVFARTIFLYHIPELHYKSIDSIDIARLQYTLDILRVRGIEVPEILVYHAVHTADHLDSKCLVPESSSSSSFSSSSSLAPKGTALSNSLPSLWCQYDLGTISPMLSAMLAAAEIKNIKVMAPAVCIGSKQSNILEEITHELFDSKILIQPVALFSSEGSHWVFLIIDVNKGVVNLLDTENSHAGTVESLLANSPLRNWKFSIITVDHQEYSDGCGVEGISKVIAYLQNATAIDPASAAVVHSVTYLDSLLGALSSIFNADQFHHLKYYLMKQLNKVINFALDTNNTALVIDLIAQGASIQGMKPVVLGSVPFKPDHDDPNNGGYFGGDNHDSNDMSNLGIAPLAGGNTTNHTVGECL